MQMPSSNSMRNGAPRGAQSSRYLVKGAVAAGATAIGALALLGTAPIDSAVAQDNQGNGSVVTPYGRAPASFADIVEKVRPAVVSISVRNGGPKVAKKNNEGKKDKKGRRYGQIPQLPDDHPLNEFFKNLPKEFGQQIPLPGLQVPKRAEGSGFMISEDGYLVTNNHVIDGANEIKVRFDKDNQYDAELVGADARTDLAVLKIDGKGKKFKYVTFADKRSRVGDWVLAVGNPFGLGGSVSAGIISAYGRDIGSGPYDYLQIDAAVNRGNSGGPAFNLQGEVIGVNTAIYSPSGGNVGIAFAVPSTTAKAVVEQLKSDGTVSRGWLGVKIQNVSDDVASSLGLNEAKGALVSEVTASGPADLAGIKARDAIVKVGSATIEDSRDLARKIAAYTPGSTVDVGLWRDGDKKTIKVKLGRFPDSAEGIAALERGDSPKNVVQELDMLGLTLDSKASKDGEGVAIAEVESGSDAERKGLRKGDVILEVQGVPVSSQKDVVEGVKRANDKNRPSVLMHIKSGSDKRFVGVQLKKQKKG